MTITDQNDAGRAYRAGVLREFTLGELLAELTRRQRGRPYTGIPRKVAETLVDMFVPEEVVNAVLLVARQAEVAITWADRHTFESTLGAEFTDEQWKRFSLYVEDFDEWDSVVDHDRVRDFAERCLDRAGLTVVEYGVDLTITDKEPRP